MPLPLPLYDTSRPVEDTSLGEVVTRIGIPLAALIVLAMIGGGNDLLRFRSTFIGCGFLAAFATLVILMRFEMGRRRFLLVGIFLAFIAVIAAAL